MSAASELARFLGLPMKVELPNNAWLNLQSFTARARGPVVYVDAAYVRINPRGVPEGGQLKKFEVREIDAKAQEESA